MRDTHICREYGAIDLETVVSDNHGQSGESVQEREHAQQWRQIADVFLDADVLQCFVVCVVSSWFIVSS